MFTIHTTLSEELITQITEHCDTHVLPHLTADVSNFAAGRQRVWFPHEAPLSNYRPWLPGMDDPRLWDWLCRTVGHYGFSPVTALIARGGEINPHRDASYAGWRAFGINFGPVTFSYEHIYQNFQYSRNTPDSFMIPPPGRTVDDDSRVEVHELTGGEVFSFCPKNPHSATGAAEDRWSINCWEINPKQAARYQKYLNKEV